MATMVAPFGGSDTACDELGLLAAPTSAWLPAAAVDSCGRPVASPSSTWPV
jgi:hypothetical protein